MISPDSIKKILLFQELTDEEIATMLSMATPRVFPSQAVIIREGEPGDSMFIMCEGEVEITKRLTLVMSEDTPQERVMIRLKAEDGVSFGEMALLENETRSATVTALTECRLLELKGHDLLKLVNQDHSLGVKILLQLARILSNHLRKANLDVVKLTTALAVALGG